MALPSEILIQIQQYCDQNTLISWTRTSRTWYHELRLRVWHSLLFNFDDHMYHRLDFGDRLPLEPPTTFLETHRDLISYLVGSCGCQPCAHCNHTAPRQAQDWQVNAIQEITIDLMQGNPDFQSLQSFNDLACHRLCDSLPNLRYIFLRGSRALAMASWWDTTVTLSNAIFQVGWIQPRLRFADYEEHPRKLRVQSRRLGYGIIRPHCLLAHIRRFEFHGLRRCDAHPFCDWLRNMQQLTWLSIASSTHGVFTFDERRRPGENRQILTRESRDRLKKEDETNQSGDYALHQFLVWLVTGSSDRDFSPRRGSRFHFPLELRHLYLRDRRQGPELDLRLLAIALVPCTELESLTLDGFLQDSVEQTLSFRAKYMLQISQSTPT